METNEISFHKIDAPVILLRQLRSPLLLILVVATIASVFLGQKTDAAVIITMITVSVLLGFWNEYRAERTITDLLKKISMMAIVIKDGVKQEIPARDLRLGDTVLLTPGAIVPADLELEDHSHLEINEAVLSGESNPVQKGDQDKEVYLGTIVQNGTGAGKVVAIGKNTRFGKISLDLSQVKPETEFQKGLRKFGLLVVRVISIMTVVIFVGNSLLGHPPIESLLFALSIAIGLTPELMPVVVTVSMSYGARRMAQKDVIVKRLVAIEDLGNMDVLATDKTGTLTEGKLSVQDYFDRQGKKDTHLLELGLMCNAAIVHHRIFGDAIDSALWHHAQQAKITVPNYKKLAQAPFDFDHRAMYCVVEEKPGRLFIYKGAPEEIINHSNLSESEKATLLAKFHSLSSGGLRVVALASKKIIAQKTYSFSDAKDLDFAGFITFLDQPKATVREALAKLAQLGVVVKIVTGDNELVTKKICSEVGLSVKNILLGKELDNLSEGELVKKVADVQVFARMSPSQKVRIIKALQSAGHAVGFLGDGVNDSPALHLADAGISVNSAVDVAKDAASIVLLKKSLAVIAEGIIEGRRVFNNTVKYVLMETSSNFGNMFSAAGASFLLPFLPMTPSQILFTNGLYDVSQLTIPTDTVDPEAMIRPRRWDTNLIKRYMLFFGPLSSLFDFLTFGVMLFVFKAKDSLFQTGWFIESLITEILVIFVIRTTRPFFQSRPSWPLLLVCVGVIVFGVAIPFTPLAKIFSFVPLPPLYFVIILLLTLSYLILVEFLKKFLVKNLYN